MEEELLELIIVDGAIELSVYLLDHIVPESVIEVQELRLLARFASGESELEHTLANFAISVRAKVAKSLAQIVFVYKLGCVGHKQYECFNTNLALLVFLGLSDDLHPV